jgi:deoxyadenosine/deoxycytidine kinase
MPQNKFDIAIIGSMGSGKSTISRKLSESLGYTLFEESFENNPWLEPYYQDPEKFALPNELWFLREKSKQHLDIALTSNSTVQDSPLQSVPLLSEAMYKCGQFHEQEYKLFLDIFDYVRRLTPSPSIIIKLDVDTSIILERIKSRARQMEKDVDEAYIQNSVDIIKNAKFNIPYITIDGNSDPDTITNDIIQHLKELKKIP